MQKLESDISVSPETYRAAMIAYMEARKIKDKDKSIRKEEKKEIEKISKKIKLLPGPKEPKLLPGPKEPKLLPGPKEPKLLPGPDLLKERGGPLAKYLPNFCPYCGRIKLRYIKKDKLYCDSCGWSGSRNDLKHEIKENVVTEEVKALPVIKEKEYDIKKTNISRRKRIKGWLKGSGGSSDEDTNPLGVSFGRRIKPRIYEVLMFVLVGAFFFIGTPIFGLPSFPFVGFAFMFFIPAYILFPSERDILSSIREGGDITGRAWLLVPKSAFKLIAFFLIIWQFFMYNRLISLVLAFIFYYDLPGRYKTSQPHKAIEAWAKMGFGVYLAYLFFLTFGGSGLAGNNVAVALGWMGAAFFITFPVQLDGDSEDRKITVVVGKYKNLADSGAFKIIDRGFFLIAMLISLWFFVAGGGNTLDMIHVVFYIMWFLSLLVGIGAGPEARPALGIMTIMIALFIFSTTYTGVIGQAVFGYWWPQVQSAGEMIMGPLDEMWYQATLGVSDAWLMMTNPQAYMNKQATTGQVTSSSTGGSKSSIEVDKFKLSSSVLDPAVETLFGDINLKNKGEFNAEYINVKIQAFWKDPDAKNTAPETSVGVINDITCSGSGKDGKGTDELGSYATCEWEGSVTRPAAYPTETAVASFSFSKGGWGVLEECCLVEELNEETNEMEDVVCEENPTTCAVGTSYIKSGNNVKVRATYDYRYNVNVSMPVDVIPYEEYERLISANQISLDEVTSEYTGGPVKATIYSREQPIRNGERSFIRVSLYNEGRGNITGIINYRIIVPVILNPENIDDGSYTFTDCSSNRGKNIWSSLKSDTGEDGDEEFMYIDCEYVVDNSHPDIERDKYRTMVFMIYPVSIKDTTKTSLIIGKASYSYRVSKDENIQVAVSPYG
ncbi:MAG: DMT family transporter [Candidatus Aenigmarchaeota archaeon]|nr:DMT family transporter [Candidatus Aenigmarchaeota archaeon]